MTVPALVAAVAALVHLLFEESLGALSPLVKMTPVAVLAALVLLAPRTAPRHLAGLGLLISAIADAVIEFSFLAGLVTFLVAHLFYIAAFNRIERRLRLSRLLPVAVWAAIALPMLVSRAGPLGVPVTTYGLVIFVMIWRASAAVERPGWNASTMGLIGALCFGLSDTLLGYSRFVAPVPAADLLIMSTYWAGQTLIAFCFLKRSWDSGRTV